VSILETIVHHLEEDIKIIKYSFFFLQNGGSLRGSPNSQPNKYYKRPSNDNYVNNNGYRSQNRYDM